MCFLLYTQTKAVSLAQHWSRWNEARALAGVSRSLLRGGVLGGHKWLPHVFSSRRT